MSLRLTGDSWFRNSARGSLSDGLKRMILPRGEVRRKNCQPSHSNCAGDSGVCARAGASAAKPASDLTTVCVASGHPTEMNSSRVAAAAHAIVQPCRLRFTVVPPYNFLRDAPIQREGGSSFPLALITQR